jgi:quercetin dioxygenase-like cupin family protein
MIRHDRALPGFLRETLESDAQLDRAALDALAVLPTLLPSARVTGNARLLAAVQALPLRYAPFFERLSRLWDLSETDVCAALARGAAPAAWRKPGLPGLRVIDVEAGPRLQGARVTLARFSAGMRFPAHRHLGPEVLLVLEGCYRDQSGRLVGPGDLHEMRAETEHFFKVGRSEPCVAASVQFGIEFTGSLMRVLTRLFG